MKKLLLAVIFTASPAAAAQTTLRAPISGPNVIPGLGASLGGARSAATPMPTMIVPTLSPGMQAPALSALALTPTPALAVDIFPAAAQTTESSPLGVIGDASADEAQKTAALDRLFDNSAPAVMDHHVDAAAPTLMGGSAGKIGPFPATEYTSLKAAIKARGVKAGLALQASRTKREGRYWFTVNIRGTSDDFKKIEDLFEKDSKGWSYAGIPTDIQLRGTPVDLAALAAQRQNEFAQAPAWFDVSKLKLDAVIKSGAGGIAVLRYGWRSQYEMTVFAFPGGESISFKEYPASPMGNPKQSFDATLETAAARKAAAQILRAAQARNPVSGKDKTTLDQILAFLE
ncbi:MAG: hypothetical protein AAB320_00930 [Elusimicrobiota bacterium]